MEQNKCTCPNCGAAATNDFNCEYCGSMLLRLTKIGLDANNSEFNQVENLLPELKRSIENQSELLKLYPEENISTAIFKDNIIPFINRERDLTEPIERGLISAMFTNSRKTNHNAKPGSISFEILFHNDEREDLLAFQTMDVYRLFRREEHTSIFSLLSYITYHIDFGEDIESASLVTSQILRKLYGDKYKYYTGLLNIKKPSLMDTKANLQHLDLKAKIYYTVVLFILGMLICFLIIYIIIKLID